MYRLGVALYRSTHFSEAVKIFNKIIESGKHLPMTYLWLGLLIIIWARKTKALPHTGNLLNTALKR